jgi:hypothetical protein
MQDYTYNESRYSISAIPCDDGDVIISVHNFPVTATFYLHNADAVKLADEILRASAVSHTKPAKEAA